MVEYSTANVKFSDTQLKKLKNAVKDNKGATLWMNLRMINGNNLPHELLLTERQKTKLRNAFNNNMSTDIKLSKAQISKIIQSGGLLGSLLSKLACPLMKVALIISNEEINDIMKIVQALEDSNILLKGVTKTIEKETKEQKSIFKCVSR